MQKIFKRLLSSALLTSALAVTYVQANDKPAPLVIQEQGGFAVGGTVISTPGIYNSLTFSPEGQTLHGDHAYIFYQIPENAHQYPLTFLHGAGQSMRTWGTTPDGREGFQTIFLRRNFSVYLIDQPRRGEAGRSTVSMPINATPDEQMWYEMFRIGVWPKMFDGVQFPKDKESLNQYFRQMTPNTGPYDEAIISDAIVALYEKTGPGVLVTHSQGGGPGWRAAIKSDKVRAVVSYEPGAFFFPQGEAPAELPTSSPFGVKPVEIPIEEFKTLTTIPIVLFYGDNIPEARSDYPGQDNWRIRLQMAKRWVEVINKHGGDATLISLPEIGVKGNTHFPFSDLNNIEIADLLSKWLHEKNLDGNQVTK